MKKKLEIQYFLILGICLFVSNFALGQERDLFNQSTYRLQMNNPAYAGSWEKFGITASGQKLWGNTLYAPRTYTLAVHSPVFGSKSGIGLYVRNYNIDLLNDFSALADYSYRFDIKGKAQLRIGLRGGFNNYCIDLSKIIITDNAIELNMIRNISWIYTGGGAFLSSKKYHVGISVPQVLYYQISDDSINFVGKVVYVSAGYIFKLNEILKFVPSINFQSFDGNNEIDLAGSFMIYNRFWLGGHLQFGFTNTLGLNFNMMVNNHLMLGYVYQTYTNSTSRSNIHELVVSYAVRFNRQRVNSPRYF